MKVSPTKNQYKCHSKLVFFAPQWCFPMFSHLLDEHLHKGPKDFCLGRDLQGLWRQQEVQDELGYLAWNPRRCRDVTVIWAQFDQRSGLWKPRVDEGQLDWFLTRLSMVIVAIVRWKSINGNLENPQMGKRTSAWCFFTTLLNKKGRWVGVDHHFYASKSKESESTN